MTHPDDAGNWRTVADALAHAIPEVTGEPLPTQDVLQAMAREAVGWLRRHGYRVVGPGVLVMYDTSKMTEVLPQYEDEPERIDDLRPDW